jgi:hypothetical protein
MSRGLSITNVAAPDEGLVYPTRWRVGVVAGFGSLLAVFATWILLDGTGPLLLTLGSRRFPSPFSSLRGLLPVRP